MYAGPSVNTPPDIRPTPRPDEPHGLGALLCPEVDMAAVDILRVGPRSTRDDLAEAVRVLHARAHAAVTHDDRVAAEGARDQVLEWWAEAGA